MHRPVLAQDDTFIQEGLDLLKAYAGISDPRAREEILAWVMEIRAGLRPGCQPMELLKGRHVDENGAERAR